MMNAERSFGDWLRLRRRAFDLTQEELARQVGCSAVTLRKLEAEARKPSKQIAERLAEILQVAPDERPAFLRFARGDPFAAPADGKGLVGVDTKQAPRHNLPLQLTSFIGRGKEIAEIRGRLTPTPGPSPSPDPKQGSGEGEGWRDSAGVGVRLLTLTGPGGTGKTRLALQVAGGLLDDYADGVWLVELAPLADPALVPQTVAAVLGVQEQAGRPLLATLTDYLRGRTALLVLDNCEHIILACAELAEKLLRVCPRLIILATSRERLGVAGEKVYPVPTLTLPGANHAMSLESLSQFEAVQLFVERAQGVLPNFVLAKDNAPAVKQICLQLDGIPLALELAAARVSLLSVEDIATRLSDRFRLLTGGSRTALPRHQTLQALIDWSHDLLPEPERVLFRRLAVFAGGWTLEAAEAVCVGEGVPADTVLDLLAQLANKSLVMTERQRGGQARYRLLETNREYALAKLIASGEADAVRRRHAEYYAPPAGKSQADYDGVLKRLEEEPGNLQPALAWSLADVNGARLGLRLASTAWYFLNFSESRRWLEAALARAAADGVSDPQAQALAHSELGNVLAFMGEYAAGQAHLDQALKLWQELGDLKQCATSLNRLGWLARERGDGETARARLEESLALCRQLEDTSGVAAGLVTLGEVMVMQENPLAAVPLLEESLRLMRAQGDPIGIGWGLNHLGHVAQLKGEYKRARRLHEESKLQFVNSQPFGMAEADQSLGETALAQGNAALATTSFTASLKLSREMGLRHCQVWCLSGLAGAAMVDEEPERAARLWGAAEALRAAMGVRAAPASRVTRERLIASAREQMGEKAFAAAWAEGTRLTLEQAVAEALLSQPGQ